MRMPAFSFLAHITSPPTANASRGWRHFDRHQGRQCKREGRACDMYVHHANSLLVDSPRPLILKRVARNLSSFGAGKAFSQLSYCIAALRRKLATFCPSLGILHTHGNNNSWQEFQTKVTQRNSFEAK